MRTRLQNLEWLGAAVKANGRVQSRASLIGGSIRVGAELGVMRSGMAVNIRELLHGDKFYRRNSRDLLRTDLESALSQPRRDGYA